MVKKTMCQDLSSGGRVRAYPGRILFFLREFF